MDDDRYTRAYRFGPLERRGLVGSWRPGQVVLMSLSCAIAVIVFRSVPSSSGFAVGLALILAGAGASTIPLAGRSLDQWAPLAMEWCRFRSTGQHRYRSTAPWSGRSEASDLPASLEGCAVVAVPLEDGRELGVVRDRTLQGYTAVLAIRMRALGLLAADEQEQRLDAWGRILASLASERGVVRRLQLLERTVPCDPDELRSYFEHSRTGSSSEAEESYSHLLASATQVTQDHELLLALQVDERRAWKVAAGDVHARGLGREEQTVAVLLRETQALARRLDSSDLAVLGLLTPEQLNAAIRLGFDPYRHRTPESRQLGPIAADTEWASYRADGALHRTFWVAEWPRLGVGPAFFSPLLLGVQAVRSVSVVLEPVAPSRARAAVEAAITSDEADEQVRAERGFRATARRRRQAESARRREEELADGHEEMRFTGFITVSGRDEEELAAACAEVEHAAQRAHLTLELLWGQQDLGLTYGALPLARGLRPAAPWNVTG
jgi:hypothetical protein